jgi:hypothetical protein
MARDHSNCGEEKEVAIEFPATLRRRSAVCNDQALFRVGYSAGSGDENQTDDTAAQAMMTMDVIQSGLFQGELS